MSPLGFLGLGPLLVGIPTYPERSDTHNPQAETWEAAMRGILAAGADNSAEKAGLAGVAIYAEWTTTPEGPQLEQCLTD